jgi:hypothetical protein
MPLFCFISPIVRRNVVAQNFVPLQCRKILRLCFFLPKIFLRKDSVSCDTIANIKYELTEINPNKTRLTIINVTLSKEGNVQNWKLLRLLNREYKKWLKNNLVEKIKK